MTSVHRDLVSEYAEVMTAAGVPERQQQEMFMDLATEVRALQYVVANCQWCWQNDYEEGLAELMEKGLRRVESILHLGRQLHSFQDPVPDVISQALAKADATLEGFVFWSLPLRVLH